MKYEKIHIKSKQLTKEDRNNILTCLNRGMNLTDTGKFIHCSASTIKREVDNHKKLKIFHLQHNKCGRKNDCFVRNICGNSKCLSTCSSCTKANCNNFCSNYTEIPQCKRLKSHCGVCNGCDNFKLCSLNKYIYNPETAQEEHTESITTSHEGVSISQEEAKTLAEFITSKLKKGHSIAAMKMLYPDVITQSEQTIYNWVDKGILPGVLNINLPRKVKYKPRKHEKEVNNDREYLKNRLYEDFLNYLDSNTVSDVVELDSVEGAGKESYIMTLLFRRFNFMLAFKLKDHTAESIVNTFNDIKKLLGDRLFSKYFKVILTDRGSEFTRPDLIENNLENKKLVNVFFCDSRQSQQKGKIEKNHVELRKIFPKGTSFVNISQPDINKAINMINSYPREIFNGRSPYELFSMYAPAELLALNDCKKISRKDLDLSPYIK